VSDTASTKQQVIAWAEEILPPGVHFIGGHPLTTHAGTGPEDASATLFAHKAYCLIPARDAGGHALETMVNLATAIGARPYFLDATEHDAYVAAVGHLPFLASMALVRTATIAPAWSEIKRLAGIDFENASSSVSADPQAYADICQTNKPAILRWLDEYLAQLEAIKALVEQGGPDLLATFTAAQEARAKWMATRDEDVSEAPAPSPVEGTGSQMKQLFMGNLMGNRPLPGEKKK
jgi:prephenate dehydrogenase